MTTTTSVALLVVTVWISSTLAAVGQDPQQVNVAQLIQDLHTKYESKLDAYESRLASYETKMLKYEARLEAYENKVKELEEKLVYQQEIDSKESDVPENTDERHSHKDPGGSMVHTKSRTPQETPKRDSRRCVLDGGDKPVAFYAQLTKDVGGIGDNQPIVFDLVTTNVGRAYNVHDGIFTTPVSGIYTFIWTVSVNGGTYMNTELVMNAIVEGKRWSDSGNHASISSSTGFAVLSLNSSDTVWIRSSVGHTHFIKGQQFTSFSGWLLYPVL